MTFDIAFHTEDWERIGRDYSAWWAGELDRPLVQVTGYDPSPNVDLAPLPHRVANYPLEMTPEAVVDHVSRHLAATRWYGDAFPRWFVDFGPGMLAGYLGAQVNVVPETVWFSPPCEVRAEDLTLRYQPENVWWQRTLEVMRAAVDAWGNRVQVSHADLGGNLDVLASFRTTEGLLTDLYDAPREVERLAGEITSLWLRYYDEMLAIIRPACPGTVPWAPIWSPATSYMLQCDFAYMISPAMFERFVLPDLEACCAHLEHGFYHLDGPAQIVHLDTLLGMERMRGVQWVPGAGNPEPQDWPDVLGRIVGAGKLCQVFVSAEGALKIVRELGGKGFMLTVNGRMEPDEAQAFLKQIAAEDRAARRR